MEPKDFTTLPLDELYPIAEGARHLLVGCRAADYSASRIANAVEDCNAKLLNLNLMNDQNGAYDILIALRVSCINIEPVIRSLSRYGYDLIDCDSTDTAEDFTLRERAEEVLRYINM